MDHRLSFLAYQPQQRNLSTSPPPHKYIDDDDYEDAHSDTSLDINLPHGWQLMVADDGETYYYYNHLTGGMRFKHPGLPESDNESDISEDGFNNDNSNKRSTITSTSTSQPRYFEERKIITADALKRLSVTASDDDSKEQYHSMPDIDDSLEKIMNSWVQRETPQGRPYFCNLITQETTWNYEDIDPLTGHLRKSNQTEEEENVINEKDTSSQTSDQQINKSTPIRDLSPNNNKNYELLDSDINVDSESSKISWSTLSTDIALSIHQLTTSAQQSHRHKLVNNTSNIVQSIRIMLYASGSMEKDSSQTQEPALREPRRSVMASLSKLVLSTKMAAESNVDNANASDTLVKVQKDANDVLSSVRNFVTTCQQGQIKIVNIDPRLVNTPVDNNSNSKRKKQNGEEIAKLPDTAIATAVTATTTTTTSGGVTTLVQKAKYPLNQDLVVSLRTHANQIYGSTDALSTSVSFLLTLHRDYQHPSDNEENDHPYTQKRYHQYQHQLYEDSVEEEHGKANIVHLFRSLSGHLSQFLSILEDIDVPPHMNIDNELPSLRSFQMDKQSLYNGVGQLFNTIQKLTDQLTGRVDAVQAIDSAIARVERSMESILTDVGEMVVQRHAWMVRREEKSNNNNNNNNNNNSNNIELDGTSLSPITPNFYDANEEQNNDDEANSSLALFNGVDDARRRGTLPSLRKQKIKHITDDKSMTNWYLAPDYKPEELVYSSDNNVKGGTLAALVEKLTMHDAFDLNYLSTFLLTYRSFCATEEFVNLLQDRYNLQAPDGLTPEQLEIWTETKQKLVRLRVFNVLKNWLENYYYEEDEFILGRLEFFTNTVIRDASPFSADQLNRLIRKRKEADNNQAGLKKMVPIKAIGQPSPIMPKNMSNFQLMDTSPKEMARQLSILDFKLYSSIRPIECLNKAWSRDIIKNGVSIAINVINSIDYCNRLTSWVTHSILEHVEAKKRISVIKYWAHVAEYCRQMNNFNTCMAVISAFDNSAIGRLKKTWELLGSRTSQILTQIRKLMGANRNFTEYREVIHSVNPPCIPFLGIYLQDLTFIEDGNQDFLKKSEGLINFAKRQKCAEVIQEIKQFQSSSYTFHIVPELQEFIKNHLESSCDVETLYERSLEIEPREPPASLVS
ncbi:unnamed protein product [Cunninghamella blakesleeana]